MSHAAVTEQVYSALVAGKAVQDAESKAWAVHYSGNCQSPLSVAQSASSGALFARYKVRCRKCKGCLNARTHYWGRAAQEMTMQAKRSWFGTLTLNPTAQEEFKQRAWEGYNADPDGSNPSWDDPKCDAAFALRRRIFLKEITKYWKRLRAAGYQFKYFLVFERHRSGLPHAHFLLHEECKPIPKRVLQAHWPFGHSNVSIVGGRSKKAAAPEKAAWYVVKYLSKSAQSRQVASAGYRPLGRNKNASLDHNHLEKNGVSRGSGAREARERTTTNDEVTRGK